jgi:hypothetical protein
MEHNCAWCGSRLEPGPGPTNRVSHGICTTCRAGLILDDGVPVLEFIESLDTPTVLVDRTRRVGALNRRATTELAAEPRAVIGRRLGLVFECVHTDGTGECGLSIHCSGCTIRRTVCHTHATGESRNRVPATLEQVRDAGPDDVVMWISTRRVGDRVLLQIEAGPDGT